MKKKTLRRLVLFITVLCVWGTAHLFSCSAAVMYGDPDSDGNVTMKDVIATQKYIVQLPNDGEIISTAMDVDANGKINMRDTVMLQRYVAGLIDAFTADATSDSDILTVRYLDVGQGDSTLVYLPNGQTALIDCGKNTMETPLVDYLNDAGVSKIDYLIGTHMDEDHIGGMDSVILNFEIGDIYFPVVPESMTPTTLTYADVLNAANSQDYEITFVNGENTLVDTDNIMLEFIAPVAGETYSAMNNYSIVTRLTYGGRKLLFMGDAEGSVERDLLGKYADISADVLKCGHHGSAYSSTENFVNAVNPSYAIISCGAGNSYGHPGESVLEYLSNVNATVYRTDLQKTIELTCTKSGLINVQTGLKSVSD